MPGCSYVCVAHMMAEEPYSLCRRGAVRTGGVSAQHDVQGAASGEAWRAGAAAARHHALALRHARPKQARAVPCGVVITWFCCAVGFPTLQRTLDCRATADRPERTHASTWTHTRARTRAYAHAIALQGRMLPRAAQPSHGRAPPSALAALSSCTVISAGYARRRWDCATETLYKNAP